MEKSLVIPKSKNDVAVIKASLKDMFLSGNNPPLEVFARLKAASEAIEDTLKDKEVKETVLSEADNYREKTFEVHGASWTKKMAGVRYDYSVCGDPVYDSLAFEKKVLEDQLKQRETFLKSIPDNGEVITDQDTGETKHIYPPAKSGSEIVQCKLL